MRGKTTVRMDGSSSFDDNFLSIALVGELEDYSSDLGEELKADIEGAAQAAVEAIKPTSPYRRGSGRGHYRSGWVHKMNPRGEDEYGRSTAIVYNRNKPTLAHLLEFGHDLVRGGPKRKDGRVVGHVDAIPHIGVGIKAAREYLASKGW